jgi:hypothetical protein
VGPTPRDIIGHTQTLAPQKSMPQLGKSHGGRRAAPMIVSARLALISNFRGRDCLTLPDTEGKGQLVVSSLIDERIDGSCFVEG